MLRSLIAKAGMWPMLLMMGFAAGTVLPVVPEATAATLEQLSLEEMVQRSTEIVRGRVISQAAEQRNGVVYTRSRVQVVERWKGTVGSTVEVSVPGGKLGKMVQTFSGAPTLDAGAEYVFFLWTGKNGVTQIIGLSQGLFDLGMTAKGATVSRAAADATMLSAEGQPIEDRPVRMSLKDLDAKIRAELGASR